MNELTTNMFENKPIRIVNLDGDAWFVAKDVCAFFGDKNYKRSLRNLDEDEKGVTQMNTPGGNQELSIVSEGGLFRLLLQMKPQKARGVSQEYIDTRMKKLIDFQRWITHEVLPSIRRTGSYTIPGHERKIELAPEAQIRKEIDDLKKEKISVEDAYQKLQEINWKIARKELEWCIAHIPDWKLEGLLIHVRREFPDSVRKEVVPVVPELEDGDEA